jgi:putative iron-dependent peroxidase
VHDRDGWNALDVTTQQRIRGRGKLNNVELADTETPSSAHRMLTTVTDAAGIEVGVLRDSMPFGSPAAGEYGTLFIGYASRPEVLETMLQNMFVGIPPGKDDRLLDFSTAVAGGLFFVPSAAMLDELVGSPPVDLYSATPVTAATRGCVQCSHLTDARTVRDIRPLRPARIMRRAGHGQDRVRSSAAPADHLAPDSGAPS